MRNCKLRIENCKLQINAASGCRCKKRIRNSEFGIRNSPLGITLIELLIVIVILTTLTAAVIPIMAPSVENRPVRRGEGRRQGIAGLRIAGPRRRCPLAHRGHQSLAGKLAGDIPRRTPAEAVRDGAKPELRRDDEMVLVAGADVANVTAPRGAPAPGQPHACPGRIGRLALCLHESTRLPEPPRGLPTTICGTHDWPDGVSGMCFGPALRGASC